MTVGRQLFTRRMKSQHEMKEGEMEEGKEEVASDGMEIERKMYE